MTVMHKLRCLRHAAIHNGCDVAKNRQDDCRNVADYARVPGVTFTGTVFKLDLELNTLVRQVYMGVTDHFDHWRS
jgi:hypothetical protein